MLGLEAIVTAVLNLDTAAVFVTPIVLHAARRRECDERPFLYGALFIANGTSLLLPGSNLTNLIVLANEHISGATFAGRLAPAWGVSVALTIAVVAIAFRRDLRDWAQLTEVLEAFATVMPAATPLGLQVQMEMESFLEP